MGRACLKLLPPRLRRGWHCKATTTRLFGPGPSSLDTQHLVPVQQHSRLRMYRSGCTGSGAIHTSIHQLQWLHPARDASMTHCSGCLRV